MCTGFPGGASGKEPTCQCRRHKTHSFGPSGRSPGEAHGNPLQYSWLENPRQEYWNELPYPPPRDLPDPRIEPASPESPALQANSLPLYHLGSPDRILLSYKKELNFAIYHNTHGFVGYYTKWSKSNREREILYDITYMWNIKNTTN